MKVTLLTAVIIAGLLLSVSSVYLNKMVFADDSWSSITQRQQASEAKASMIYNEKYQYNNLPSSVRDYNPLFAIGTDTTTKGRDLAALAQMSMENALATFDKEHIMQLTGTWGAGYPGLTSVSTDEKARDRNVMIAQARGVTDQNVADLISQLSKISQTYSTMELVATTTGYAVNRQAQIESVSSQQQAQAADLVNQIWQIDQQYVNLQSGGTTNEQTQGRQIAAAQAYSLMKAVQIFEEIHAQKLAATYATGYTPLSSSTTNEQIVGPGLYGSPDRATQISVATEMALENAINFYNAYYPNTPLSLPNYSH